MINEKQLKFLNLLGEGCVYLFIISLFLNRGINLKVGYILQGLFFLKLIFDRKNIKIKGKEVYRSFGIILVLGILMNLFVSKKNGVSIFFNQNIHFIFGMAFLSFIDDMKKLKKAIGLIMTGSAIMAISEIADIKFIDYSYSRTRPLIMMGAVLSTILFFENLKTWLIQKKINYNILIMVPLILTIVGIMYSDSRMGFLVYIISIGLYGAYNLTLYKLNIKSWSLLLLVFSILAGGIILSMPKEFESKIKTSFQTKNNFSNEARLVMWQGGLYAFLDKPITGVGSAKIDTQPYNMKSAKEYSTENKNGYMQEVFVNQKQFSEHHSIYVNFLSQNGIVLTLLYLYLFFIQIPKRFFLNRKDKTTVSSYFTMASFLIYGVTWSVWTVYSVAQILFQIFLAIFILSTEERGE